MYIVLTVAGVTLAVFVLIALVIRNIKKRAMAIINEHFSPDEVLRSSTGANFFGLTSQGAAQVRGNGPLVLTREKLWFYLLMPERTVEIPLDAIIAMEVRKSHLGKATPYPLLYVEFTSGEETDSAGWLVRDPGQWIADINDLSK